MNHTKGLSLVLATGILLAGSGMTAAAATAAPTYASPATFVAPPAPTDDTVLVDPVGAITVDPLTSSKATLTWTEPAFYVDKIVNYTVTLKKSTGLVRIVTVPHTVGSGGTGSGTHTLYGLLPGTDYTAEVRANAVSANGDHKLTSAPTLVSFATPKDSKANVSFPSWTRMSMSKVGSDRVTVNWPEPIVRGTLTGYTVQVEGGGVNRWLTASPKATSMVVTGLKPETKYLVSVVGDAVSDDGSSTYSAGLQESVTTAKDPAGIVNVAAPKSLKTLATTNSITASWGKPSVTGKVTSYTLTLKQGSRTVKTYSTSKTSQKFTGLNSNTGYTVYVKANAVSTNGKSKKASSTVSKSAKTVSRSAVKVSKPASVKTAAAKRSVTVSWKKPAVTGKVTSYTVTLKQGKKTVKVYTTTGTQKTFTKLKKNTSYKVYVKANAKSANGKYKKSSSTVSKVVKTKK